MNNFRSLVVVLAVALSVGMVAPAAQAVELEDATSEVARKDLKVSYVDAVQVPKKRRVRLHVELNDGSAWLLKPCKYEDSEHCYWNAGKFGNGQGHSFVRVLRKTFYLN